MPGNPVILFVDQYSWPDVASAGQHCTDMAERLAASEFRVQVRSAFHQRSGVPMVLNTSFNENELIVHRPDTADEVEELAEGTDVR